MGDHILRPMGAATLRIERDTQPNQMTVAIECERGHCHSLASVSSDLAGILGLEAAGQHFDCPAAASEWIRSRISALTPSPHGLDGTGMARDWLHHSAEMLLLSSDPARSRDTNRPHIQQMARLMAFFYALTHPADHGEGDLLASIARQAENTAGAAMSFIMAEGGSSFPPPPSASSP
jgi:hypothetical protein